MIRIVNVDGYILNMKTRLPFKYGITTLTELPHFFLKLDMEIDDKAVTGIASDGLAPKWFKKDPETSIENDIDELLKVIDHAGELIAVHNSGHSIFDIWRRIYDEQEKWADDNDIPHLLSGFGVSLYERAMMDGFCRAKGMSFHNAIMNNAFGIDLGGIYPELKGCVISDLLPSQPIDKIQIRHTVGMADLLFDAENELEPIADGLPVTLESVIARYGVNHFKIKLSGDYSADLNRLLTIKDLLQRCKLEDYHFTLDGNERFEDVHGFKDYWIRLTKETELTTFLNHLLYVEQPIKRQNALTASIATELNAWIERPRIIIDESDGDFTTLTSALASGYCGISHKNCKGIIKGLANACLIQQRNKTAGKESFIQCGEDLANVGPVALLQDLTVMATLGMTHVERNGHHYFKGLSMYSEEIQKVVLEQHRDLYMYTDNSYPTLKIDYGFIQIDSLLAAPFGYDIDLDPSIFVRRDKWKYDTLTGE